MNNVQNVTVFQTFGLRTASLSDAQWQSITNASMSASLQLGAGIISVPRGLSAGETRDVAIAIRDASAVPNKVTGGS